MPADLAFYFYLADRKRPVRRCDPLTTTPLPLNRSGTAPSTDSSDVAPPTYGNYFRAIRDFINKDPEGTLCRPVSELLKKPITPAAIECVNVFLVKHGELYHPCRVVTVTENKPVDLALNGAVSENGRLAIGKEYGDLKRLGTDFGYDFIPRVYAFGSGADGSHRPIQMFLAQWFAGFHECHLTRDPLVGAARIRVWDAGQKDCHLTESQTADYYRKCARILTSYYNPLTFEQIFPWHHAAGDFIVSPRTDGVDVKLITVRGYTPLIAATPADPPDTPAAVDEARILEGLLVFFLSMSVRMRLDRLDGVGPIVWAPEGAVEGALHGYFQGLASICERYGFPEHLPQFVRRYLLAHPREELAELCAQIGGRYPAGSEEGAAIRRHAPSHAKALYRRAASMAQSAPQ